MNLFVGCGDDRHAGSEVLGPGAVVLRGFAAAVDGDLLAGVATIAAAAPFRHMITSGGTMSVAMTNCGSLGWVSDRTGYRYDSNDPESGRPWPTMPESFFQLAEHAAASAGYSRFVPDACLINRYEARARMSLHQDKDERDFREPIVSVSLGLPATFLFGGDERADKAVRVAVTHGDVVVWGGPTRLRYHGVLALKNGLHSRVGSLRINLTFRKAR